MKDSYSFDLDRRGPRARRTSEHREAYIKLFERLGLPFVIVSAMSGAMGGSASEEFLAPLEIGEDTLRALRDRAGTRPTSRRSSLPPPTPIPFDGLPAAVVHDTPDTPTIATLVDYVNAVRGAAPRPTVTWTAADTLKNVIVTLRQPDGSTSPLAIGATRRSRGRHEAARGAGRARRVAEAFTEERLRRSSRARQGLHRARCRSGSASRRASGSWSTRGSSTGTSWITGADRTGNHVIGLVAGRDFTPDGTIEAAEVRDGDVCPTCGSPLEMARGIEIGHIFQLGRKYAEALELTVRTRTTPIMPTMGSYGVGVTRCAGGDRRDRRSTIRAVLAARDLPGRRPRRDRRARTADRSATPPSRSSADLEAAGVSVLIDDRVGVSPGVRFKDAELIGIPTIVVVGRGIADESNPTIEVKDRRSGERVDVALPDAVAHLVATCAH